MIGSIIFGLVLVVAGFFARKLHNQVEAPMKPIGLAVIILGLLIPIGRMAYGMFRVISPGQVGVQILFGEVKPVPLPEGLNIINPVVDVEQMSVQIQKHEAKYDSASKDMQVVHVEMTLNFAIVPAKAPEIYRSIGLKFADVIVYPAAQEVLKAETALHNASEILQLRPKIKEDVQTNLKKWLEKYGIALHEVSLANISFGPDYTAAIEKKQIEEQKAEQKKYELRQAETDAQIRAAKAKGEADAVIEGARGEAESLKLRGEAQAQYNQKVAESLTETLIASEYIKKWDGQLPQMMTGSGGTLLQIPIAPKRTQ